MNDGVYALSRGRKATARKKKAKAKSATGPDRALLSTPPAAWKKGAIHVHTLWSDGRGLPEVAIKVYQDSGYDFIALTDHNVFQEDSQAWRELMPVEGNWPPSLSPEALQLYEQNIKVPLDKKTLGFKQFVRLKTFRELKKSMEIPGRFLLLPGEEITILGIPLPNGEIRQVHMNYLNLEQTLPPLEGRDISETIRINQEKFEEAAGRTRKHSFFMVNHPQWQVFDVEPCDLIENTSVRHFEICNDGSSFFIPDGIYSLEKFWDIVLAHRIEDGGPVLYGAASDDAHYTDPVRMHGTVGVANAWIMVNCPGKFTAGNVIAALNRGDYYPTCGVLWEKLSFVNNTLSVKVKPEEGVHYMIRFVTTKRGFDRTVRRRFYPNDTQALGRNLLEYSDDIGKVVKEVENTEGAYTMEPDDLYVRAIAISNRKTVLQSKLFPVYATGWTQPYLNQEGLQPK